MESLSSMRDSRKQSNDSSKKPKEFQPDEKIYSYAEAYKKAMEEDAFSDKHFIWAGIKKLDDMIRGFKKGELIVLTGSPKAGKTSAAQTISFNQAVLGIPVLWFSLEMGWQEFTKTFMDMDDFLKRSEAPPDLPLYYPIESSKISIPWLKKKIHEAKEQHNIQMVYIDNLHDLAGLEATMSSGNSSLFFGLLVNELKKIAIAENVVIFLIVHAHKLSPYDIPNAGSIRDSGLVAHICTMVMCMWRVREPHDPTKDSGEKTVLWRDESRLSVEYNRRGGHTGVIKLYHYDGKFFDEPTPRPFNPNEIPNGGSDGGLGNGQPELGMGSEQDS